MESTRAVKNAEIVERNSLRQKYGEQKYEEEGKGRKRNTNLH